MSIITKITALFSSDTVKKVVDTVLDQFPAKIGDLERSQIERAVLEATRTHELKIIELAMEQEADFNNRIKDLEGTATDLKAFGILGKLIVFLRGAQRPIWGYSVLVMDFMVFSGNWKLSQLQAELGQSSTIGANLESAFWVINFLVLGFLFGERAMKNVVPLLKGLKG